jgi:DNA repair protein RecO (recombination protein O)
VLRCFELALLSDLGYAQTLDRLSGGGAVLAHRRYGYAYGQGVVEPGAGDAAYSGRTLLDLAAGDFSNPRTLSEGKLFMRALINHYLGDKPLYTRQLLLDLQTL